MALSFAALLSRHGRTAPDTSMCTRSIRYAPYAEELRNLREELDARLSAVDECDPEDEAEHTARLLELHAADVRMQGLAARAQREQAIAEAEDHVESIKAKISDPSGGDLAILQAESLEADRYLEGLRTRPIEIQDRAAIVGSLFAFSGTHQ